MAMRSILNLNISLGMFGFPVKVYKAVNDPAEGISFRQVHAACGTPINQVKRCSCCNVDVTQAELVKGYEQPGGPMLIFQEDEIKALKPEAMGTVKVDGYLAADEIDPCYQDGPIYYLSPDRGTNKKGDCDTFTTWRDALAGRWAIGKVVMYGREHVVAIRSVDRLLAMHFIRTHSEIRNVFDVPAYDTVPETSKSEYAELMGQLIRKSTIAFDDVVLESDAYTDSVKALIESRKAGQPAPAQSEFKPASTGGDLLAMLKASLAAQA